MLRFSIVIPIYPMKDWQFFLKRCLDSVYAQTFTDYEVVITCDGKMAENTNSGIRKSKGELIKVLFMDDYFTSEFSLENIDLHFTKRTQWLVTGCFHDDGVRDKLNPHIAVYSEDVNTIGSPSVLTFRNDNPLLFDESMSWMLDLDLYKRMHKMYGLPKILDSMNVTIGLGPHQHTNVLTDQEKLAEQQALYEKHSTE